MSSVRYRSHSHASPQITQRILQHDFEVVGDVMTALDGFSSAGPILEPMVLQRPTRPLQRSFLQQLLLQARNLFGMVRTWR